MTGEEAKLRYDAAAKAVKEGDPRAEELIGLCLPSDQNVLRERVNRASANETEWRGTTMYPVDPPE